MLVSGKMRNFAKIKCLIKNIPTAVSGIFKTFPIAVGGAWQGLCTGNYGRENVKKDL